MPALALHRIRDTLLQRHAGDLHRLAPQRDLLGDEGGEACRVALGGGLRTGATDVLDEACIVEGAAYDNNLLCIGEKEV